MALFIEAQRQTLHLIPVFFSPMLSVTLTFPAFLLKHLVFPTRVGQGDRETGFE